MLNGDSPTYAIALGLGIIGAVLMIWLIVRVLRYGLLNNLQAVFVAGAEWAFRSQKKRAERNESFQEAHAKVLRRILGELPPERDVVVDLERSEYELRDRETRA